MRSPTKPYQDLCSRCETHWQIRFGLPTVTTVPIWPSHRYRIVLPNITSREINRLYATIIPVLLCDVMPTWLCPIPQEHTPEAVASDTTRTHGSGDTTDPTVADPGHDSGGPVHPVQHIHIPRTHLPGTRTPVSVRAPGSTAPIRSVGAGPPTPRPAHSQRTTQYRQSKDTNLVKNS